MQRTSAALLYCPRMLTLVALVVVASLLVLANLSFDQVMDWVETFGARSYGWPLVWRRFIYFVSGDNPTVTVGWYYSGGRLLANLAIWVMMLAAAGGACEWLSRCYRPCLRWSLRTMLAGVGLAALLCTWFVALRKQADLQEPLTATSYGVVWFERWGPKWLDLVGADRFRRRVIGARLYTAADREDGRLEGVFNQLSLLPEMRYLFVEGKPQTPDIADKRLLIASSMWKLEYLRLRDMALHGKRLACLSRLTRLRRLDLSGLSDADKDESGELLLADLPELPLLEGLDLQRSQIQDRDLRRLARLPHLKALSLAYSNVTGDGLAELRRMPALEELEIDAKMLSEAGLKMLAECKFLKSLHIVPEYAIHRRSKQPAKLMLNDEDWVYVLENDLASIS